MNDFRFAFRQLFKSPAFTIVAVVTLGLGIAASTAIFSVVDAVLLHPLPYPDSERIVTVSQTVRSTGVSTQDASPANFIDWAAQNSVFSAMACTRGWQANLSGGEAAGAHPRDDGFLAILQRSLGSIRPSDALSGRRTRNREMPAWSS